LSQTRITAQNSHNILYDCWIMLKFLLEFSDTVFPIATNVPLRGLSDLSI